MEPSLSFTGLVKEELTTNTYDSTDRLRALLAAYIRINGSLLFRDKKTLLSLKTENAKIGKFIYQTINSIYNAHSHIDIVNKNTLNKKPTYVISIDDTSETIIDDLEISFLEGKISKNIVRNDDTIAGYLTGAFLASGSVNSPSTSNYHLEISLGSENYAKWLSHLFARYKNSNIEPKISKRRDKYILYFKKSDQIANFLIIIGAVSACLEFEDVRANRDFMNNANRLENSDMANMKKAYEAGKRQVEEIKTIDKIIGIKNLTNQKAALLCQLRLENEGATLQELADLFNDRNNSSITKSNVNHLFRYIHEKYLRCANHEDDHQ